MSRLSSHRAGIPSAKNPSAPSRFRGFRRMFFVGDIVKRDAHFKKIAAGQGLRPLRREWRDGEPLLRDRCLGRTP